MIQPAIEYLLTLLNNPPIRSKASLHKVHVICTFATHVSAKILDIFNIQESSQRQANSLAEVREGLNPKLQLPEMVASLTLWHVSDTLNGHEPEARQIEHLFAFDNNKVIEFEINNGPCRIKQALSYEDMTQFIACWLASNILRIAAAHRHKPELMRKCIVYFDRFSYPQTIPLAPDLISAQKLRSTHNLSYDPQLLLRQIRHTDLSQTTIAALTAQEGFVDLCDVVKSSVEELNKILKPSQFKELAKWLRHNHMSPGMKIKTEVLNWYTEQK